MTQHATLGVPARTPIAPPTTRTATLAVATRRTGLFRELVPMEAATGWPIPLLRGEHLGVTFPYAVATAVRGEGVTALLHPPVATITVDWFTGRPVSFTDLRWQSPAPDLPWAGEVGTFPHEAVAGTVASYLQAKDRLMALTDALMSAAADGQLLAQAAAEEYTGLLARLVEPALLPYYRAIAPDFVARFAP